LRCSFRPYRRGMVPCGAEAQASSLADGEMPQRKPEGWYNGSMRASSAFSLIEMLVVLSIIVILAAMLLPGLRVVRQTVNRVQCQANLRQIGVAMQGYVNDNRGIYPTCEHFDVAGYGTYRTWLELLLENLDCEDADRDGTVTDRDLRYTPHNVLKGCPSWEDRPSISVYGYGMNGCLRMPEIQHSSVVRPGAWYVEFRASGTTYQSYRILVGDCPGWHLTNNSKYGKQMAPTRHRGASNYLFCDLHVQALPPTEAELGLADPAKLAAE
jgi:prepilin-type N-terminal cleavage/methylation domain-containing protein/prepilin-type processing-associated H-X9-DG protein